MTWALATIGVLLVGCAAFSRRLEGLSVSSAMFFTTAGLLAGPVLGQTTGVGGAIYAARRGCR